ncbi:MAG TPA: aryl-sulfate sulfotransferase [Thermodesulfobacteriota bacterium]|nr:aryl-sulfate sulfotransferase [Thermodesulfobacteriota bacterium]
MKKKLSLCLALLLAAGFLFSAHAYEATTGPTGVLKYEKGKAFEGYTLFSPTTNCKTTYLIDMEGNVVHKWESEYNPALHSILLPNGNLLRAGALPQKNELGYIGLGGVGGIIEEFDWSGKKVWEYKLYSPGKEYQHHTFDRMPNGNTMILAWEYKSKAEGIAKGRDPKTLPEKPIMQRGKPHDGFWVDFVREVDKNGRTVWEWHAWDHIGKGPKKLDINYKLPEPVGLTYPNYDWSHFNAAWYLPKTDQVLLNSRNFAEFYLVNHKTGEIEYRWGNPSAYGAGKAPSWYDNGGQKVFGTHCPVLLENGNILLFDNGSERPEGNRSAAVEVNPKTGEIVWEYEAKHSASFYSYRQGAVQRLPNGNTLITSTHGGHLIEVTPDKKVVWDFVNPIYAGKGKCVASEDDAFAIKDHMNATTNMIHRAYRYGPDYPGLKGKDLSKKVPLVDGCPYFFKDYGSK